MLAEQVAPDNPMLGCMLPYAPVQSLIFDYDDDIKMPSCLVMTSGNLSGLPICRNDDDVRAEIRSYCDVVLTHNRKIIIRADDSVMDFYDGKPYMIRRSRGYAPLPYMMTKQFKGSVIAYGGELKNTFCVAVNSLIILLQLLKNQACRLSGSSIIMPTSSHAWQRTTLRKT